MDVWCGIRVWLRGKGSDTDLSVTDLEGMELKCKQIGKKNAKTSLSLAGV